MALPIAYLGLAAAGYLVVRKETAVPFQKVDGQSPPKQSVIPETKAAPSKSSVAKQTLGALSGAAIGAFVGGQLGQWAVESVASYDAPLTKGLAVPVFTAVGAIGGGLIGAALLNGGIVIATVTLTAVAACIIVAVVLVAVYAVFVIAALIEDGIRYNAWQDRRVEILRLVKDKKYKAALMNANDAASEGKIGLGFRIGPMPVDYSGAGAHTAVFGYTDSDNRLPQGFVIDGIKHGEWDKYFGIDGAEIMTKSNGAVIDTLKILKQAHSPLNACWNAFRANHANKAPTAAEWEKLQDDVKDNSGITLREYVDAANAYGKAIAPGAPWLAEYYFQWKPPTPFTLTAAELAVQTAENNEAKTDAQNTGAHKGRAA